jgi:tRNA threonylcarbamoyladenosine biosynthesis protein TsaB
VLVLALDASTYAGSVALIRDDIIVGESVVAMRGEHEERLMPAIATVLADHSIPIDRLDAVACGAGPGSFTSLRIAASIAKGLCAAREIPLLVAPSTLLTVPAADPPLPPGGTSWRWMRCERVLLPGRRNRLGGVLRPATPGAPRVPFSRSTLQLEERELSVRPSHRHWFRTLAQLRD